MDPSLKECPLCCGELDSTDLSFKPCKCGYQICIFCYNKIKNDQNTCPYCRLPYKEENIILNAVPDEGSKKDQRRKKKNNNTTSSNSSIDSDLSNVRVKQRNLVYVTNIGLDMAKEEVLMKHELFGRFGDIKKIVVNNGKIYKGPDGPSVSAYITYKNKGDAMKAIEEMDSYNLNGRMLHASFGTTKYCTFFLRGVKCPNPECMYLHELGDQVDSFTKEDIAKGKLSKHANVAYQRRPTNKYPSSTLSYRRQGTSQNIKKDVNAVPRSRSAEKRERSRSKNRTVKSEMSSSADIPNYSNQYNSDNSESKQENEQEESTMNFIQFDFPQRFEDWFKIIFVDYHKYKSSNLCFNTFSFNVDKFVAEDIKQSRFDFARENPRNQIHQPHNPMSHTRHNGYNGEMGSEENNYLHRGSLPMQYNQHYNTNRVSVTDAPPGL